MADCENNSSDWIDTNHLDMLQCSICVQQFTFPVMLQCFHTFCKTCLEPLQKSFGSIHCPICQENDDRNIDLLDKNLYMEALICLNNSKSSNIICESCEASEAVNWKCVECDQMMCNACQNVHKRLKACKDHEVIVFDFEKSKIKLEKERHCTKHPHELVRFACNSCKVPICRDCKLTTHEKHETVDLKDVVSGANKWVKAETKSLDSKIAAFQRVASHLNSCKELSRSNTIACCLHIDEIEAMLHKFIAENCKTVKGEITKTYEDQFKKEILENKKILEKIVNIKSYMENVFSIGSDGDKIQCKADLDEKIQLLKKLKVNNINERSITIPSVKSIYKDASFIGTTSCEVFLFKEKCKFQCEKPTENAYVSSIYTRDGNLYISFNQPYGANTARKMVHMYTSTGQLSKVFPIPPQFVIAVNSEGKIISFDEHRGIIFYPSSDDVDKNKRISSGKPIAMDISEHGDIISLDVTKTLTKNFIISLDLQQLFASPMSLCCVKNEIWVTDSGCDEVVICDSTGQKVSTFKASNLVENFHPHGICYNSKMNRVFVSDSKKNVVIAVEPVHRLAFILLAECDGLQSPTCLATYGNEIWVCDRGTRINAFEVKC